MLPIETVSQLRFSDLNARPGIVFVQPECEIFQFEPEPKTGFLAGVCLPDGDGKGMPRYVAIDFHGGRKSWCLAIEHSIQKQNEYRMGILPDVIQFFEAEVGVTLPVIKVCHYGVGVYPASSRNVSENPWALQNGMFYSVVNRHGRKRTMVADVHAGQTRVCFVADDGTVSEAFEAGLVLDMNEWKTLQPLNS